MSFFVFCYAEGSFAACRYAECRGATKTLSTTIIKYNIQNRDTNQLPNAVMFCHFLYTSTVCCSTECRYAGCRGAKFFCENYFYYFTGGKFFLLFLPVSLKSSQVLRIITLFKTFFCIFSHQILKRFSSPDCDACLILFHFPFLRYNSQIFIALIITKIGGRNSNKR